MAWYQPPFRAFRDGSNCRFFNSGRHLTAFFLVQFILPGRRVTGYVVNPETGEPRNYKLNGILVFAIAMIVWAFELTGMPRDWFYRSSIYSVAGGTVFCLVGASSGWRVSNPCLRRAVLRAEIQRRAGLFFGRGAAWIT